jgi:hypothetical protein
MKKTIIYFILSILIFSSISSIASVNISMPVTKITSNVLLEKAYADSLLNRLNVIDEMDKTNMTKSQKKNLRQEVKAIDKSLVRSSGGIFLSAGAILAVILLLIILL